MSTGYFSPALTAVKKMSEQYRLTPTMIKNIVTQKKPGNYRLGKLVNGQSRIKYVGRSDTDVAFRLLTHISEGYSWFKFCYADSAEEAFERECNEYHANGGPEGKLDNVRHPDRPKGSNYKCPRCKIFD